ncbi:thiamine pyrophosphate protein domain protein TPP-binding protein [Methanocaldococcus infernus ME]|uniref:Thiamine pyrophosphate protein domain protein TPP-binding protein n=1 Tax=Methanocaldococcus infernus (strain DSM 11812 / JCM 15783 / ME) TaxID=573063 RepID=D5VQD2_METIM|nr:thiamine pyrophosphate-binding protein [Methanocaldococcus infernus]ADG12785.1 thiamine pyrophosphate protein domain protein TPP-binding protein [Methanocaldococcus infernus ME]
MVVELRFYEYITNFLEERVRTLFSYPGEQIYKLFEEINNSKIKNIVAADERGAGFMADGYARISNYFSVCLATAGPGGCNLTTPLATAYKDSSSVLAITGRPTRKYIGENYFQELNLDFLNFHKGFFVNEPKTSYLEKSLSLLEYKKPVHLNIPSDVLEEEVCEVQYTEEREEREFKEVEGDLLLVGQGIYGTLTYKEILKINKLLSKFPVATTFPARGVVKEEENIGLVGRRGDIESLKKAKKIINLGASLSYNTYVESLREELLKKTINLDIQRINYSELKNLIKNLNIDFSYDIKKRTFKAKGDYSRKVEALINNLPEDSILVLDAGKHTVFTSLLKTCNIPKSIIASHSFGCMGFSLPGSIGVKFATEDFKIDREVVSISGDGGFIMNIQELKVVSQHNLKILFVVFENNKLANFCRIENPDFIKIAEAFGIEGYRVESLEEIEDYVKDYLKGNKPLILSIKVEDEDLPKPNT